MSLRSIGDQIAHFVGSFRGEFRDKLRRVVRANFEMYNFLLAMLHDIGCSDAHMESPITITDALNRVHDFHQSISATER